MPRRCYTYVSGAEAALPMLIFLSLYQNSYKNTLRKERLKLAHSSRLESMVS